MPGPARRERPRLLLVEDHRHMRQMLAQLFTLSGWDVVECRDLDAAYRSLATHYGIYDAALIDILLPDGSGSDFVADLARLGGARRIVVHTACESGNARVDAAIANGAHGVIYKPAEFGPKILPVVLGTHPGDEPRSAREDARPSPSPPPPGS